MMTKIPMGTNLKLTNDGELELLFLGTGSAFVKENFQNNLLVVKGQDHLLVDCGTRCPEAFHRYKSSLLQIKNVFVSHSHSDHTGGIEELALMHRYATHTRPNFIITDEYKEILWNETLKGGLSYGERGTSKFGNSVDGYLTFEDYFNQINPVPVKGAPRPLFETNIGSINIKIYRTMHMPDCAKTWEDSQISFGILIDERILFPCDTRFDPELLNWMEETYHPEIILHDCQAIMGGVHASIIDLKTLPENIRKKLLLCHYADSFADFNAQSEGFAGLAKPAIYYNFGK